MKFLDSTGLGILWNKIKNSFLALNGGGQNRVKITNYDSIIFAPTNDYSNRQLEINNTIPEYAAELGEYGFNLILKNTDAPNELVINVNGIGNRNNPERNFVYREWDSIIEGDTALTTEELNEVLV